MTRNCLRIGRLGACAEGEGEQRQVFESCRDAVSIAMCCSGNQGPVAASIRGCSAVETRGGCAGEAWVSSVRL